MAEPTSSTPPAAPPDFNPPPMATGNAATQLDPAPAPNLQPQTSVPPPTNPNLNPNNSASTLAPPPPPLAFPSSYGLPPPPPMYGAPLPPSFRPVQQFPNFQNQNAVGVQPPGVGAGTTANTAMPHYQVPPGQHPNQILRPPYGYPTPQGIMPPPGMPRYPPHFPGMLRPNFHPRPPGAPGLLPMSRPLVPNIPGVRPFIPPIMRPAVPSVTPAEKPQTTVYVGKISPSVKNDFMLSLLQSCGPVKSWKRAESDGTPRGFGFCEFENAEGILRALRLLSKLNIDGQELVLNVNQATKEYLDRYVEKKTENSKNLGVGVAVADKQDNAPTDAEKSETSEKTEPAKSSVDDSENDDGKGDKGVHDLAKFGIVTDEDKEGDRVAMETVTNMIEERIKTRPLPPPPPPPPLLPTDGSFNPNIEQFKSRDGDSDTDGLRSEQAEEKNNDETSSDYKAANEHDRPEVTSPDRNRRHDRRSRDGTRDVKHEKEREMERYEREAERERVRKEREQRRKVDDAEREYEERLRDWEYREREKEKQRQYEKEREKERERKRRKEILHDEEEEADDSGKRWRRSVIEEKRRKRRQEKEEDIADKLKEDEEIAEAKKRAEEEKLLQQETDALKLPSPELTNGSNKAASPDEMVIEIEHKVVVQGEDGDSVDANHTGDETIQNGDGETLSVPMVESEEHQQNANAPTRKLGFGLLGSGKRANVPSVFHDEDDEDAHKDKKMGPLVPIDYSTEELEAVQPVASGTQPANLVAAAEYAKQISNIAPREEKSEGERDRKQRSHDRSSRRDRNDENSSRARDDNRKKSERDRDRDHGSDKVKTPDKQKLLDAKQLIDMIPKTKDELFSYQVNWAVYDKHSLHDRMRPWISKKVTEFLGEEETTLVDYIVSSTKEHVKAEQMLEMLQSILDDEAEMFVLKMWRMLIFEVKKVETGLALKSK